jgi:hypothetical protein
MRWIRTLLIAAAFVPQLAHAQYSNGYVESGYTYNDGYWWSGDWAYTRTVAYRNVWDSYYCRYYSQPYYVYTKAYQKQAQKTQVAPGYEGWRKDLLAIAQERDRWEGYARQSEQEQKEFLETVDALGLYGNLRNYPSNLTGAASGYSNAYPGAYQLYGSHSTYQAPFAPQGSTLYGYDQQSVSYTPVDLKLLYNQSYNLVKGLSDITGGTLAGHQQLVQEAGTQNSEVAKILARGQAGRQLLQMLRDEPKTVHEKTEFNLTPAPKQPVPRVEEDPIPDPPAPEPQGSLSSAEKDKLVAVIQRRCLECHKTENKEGSLDLTKYFTFTPDRKREIAARLVTEDESKRMPRGKGGDPVDPLAITETALFFKAAGVKVE